MNSIEKLKQKQEELESKLAEKQLKAKINKLEKEIEGKGKVNFSQVEMKEGLSNSEMLELKKAYERISFFQSNIRNSVSFPTDEQMKQQMKELEDEKLSFGQKLSKYSKKQQTEITDEMIKNWERG